MIDIMIAIQQKLKAPKDQTNDFGGYKYRSAESIMEAVKPILAEHEAYLHLSDEVVECGGKVYIRATATVYHGKEYHSASALAREQDEKKGMDTAQITGAASSYARKYALNGLFGIDDTKDPDTNEYHGGDEIIEPTHRFKKGEKEEILKQIRDAVYNGEASHLAEIWREQEKTAQMKIWPELTASERSSMKQLLEESNE